MASLKQRFANWILRDADLDLKSTAGWLEMLRGNKTISGQIVTEESSLKYSAVNLAVRLRGETRASLPLMIYKNKNGIRQEATEHPLWRMLAFQPNPWMNYFDFWFMCNSYLDLWGNAYFIKYRKRGQKYPSALIPIHPSKVEPKLKEGKIIYKVNSSDSYNGEHSYDEVIHFKGVCTDGLKGKGPIQLAAESVGLAMAEEEFGSKYFEKGGVIRQVIESPNVIDDKAYGMLKKRWNEMSDHDTAILDRGMALKKLDMAPEAAQFLSSRGFQIQEIARWFNVPTALLQSHEASTFRNIEHQDLTFGKYTIRPILKRDESELECKLLGDDWPEYNIKWNLDAILRADIKSRADYYSKMIQIRAMNPNEVRALENMNPYPGGDKYENPNTTSENGQNNKAIRTVSQS